MDNIKQEWKLKTKEKLIKVIKNIQLELSEQPCKYSEILEQKLLRMLSKI
jgi:hypothetical protein